MSIYSIILYVITIIVFAALIYFIYKFIKEKTETFVSSIDYKGKYNIENDVNMVTGYKYDSTNSYTYENTDTNDGEQILDEFFNFVEIPIASNDYIYNFLLEQMAAGQLNKYAPKVLRPNNINISRISKIMSVPYIHRLNLKNTILLNKIPVLDVIVNDYDDSETFNLLYKINFWYNVHKINFIEKDTLDNFNKKKYGFDYMAFMYETDKEETFLTTYNGNKYTLYISKYIDKLNDKFSYNFSDSNYKYNESFGLIYDINVSDDDLTRFKLNPLKYEVKKYVKNDTGTPGAASTTNESDETVDLINFSRYLDYIALIQKIDSDKVFNNAVNNAISEILKNSMNSSLNIKTLNDYTNNFKTNINDDKKENNLIGNVLTNYFNHFFILNAIYAMYIERNFYLDPKYIITSYTDEEDNTIKNGDGVITIPFKITYTDGKFEGGETFTSSLTDYLNAVGIESNDVTTESIEGTTDGINWSLDTEQINKLYKDGGFDKKSSSPISRKFRTTTFSKAMDYLITYEKRVSLSNSSNISEILFSIEDDKVKKIFDDLIDMKKNKEIRKFLLNQPWTSFVPDYSGDLNDNLQRVQKYDIQNTIDDTDENPDSRKFTWPKNSFKLSIRQMMPPGLHKLINENAIYDTDIDIHFKDDPNYVDYVTKPELLNVNDITLGDFKISRVSDQYGYSITIGDYTLGDKRSISTSRYQNPTLKDIGNLTKSSTVYGFNGTWFDSVIRYGFNNETVQFAIGGIGGRDSFGKGANSLDNTYAKKLIPYASNQLNLYKSKMKKINDGENYYKYYNYSIYDLNEDGINAFNNGIDIPVMLLDDEIKKKVEILKLANLKTYLDVYNDIYNSSLKDIKTKLIPEFKNDFIKINEFNETMEAFKDIILHNTTWVNKLINCRTNKLTTVYNENYKNKIIIDDVIEPLYFSLTKTKKYECNSGDDICNFGNENIRKLNICNIKDLSPIFINYKSVGDDFQDIKKLYENVDDFIIYKKNDAELMINSIKATLIKENENLNFEFYDHKTDVDYYYKKTSRIFLNTYSEELEAFGVLINVETKIKKGKIIENKNENLFKEPYDNLNAISVKDLLSFIETSISAINKKIFNKNQEKQKLTLNENSNVKTFEKLSAEISILGEYKKLLEYGKVNRLKFNNITEILKYINVDLNKVNNLWERLSKLISLPEYKKWLSEKGINNIDNKTNIDDAFDRSITDDFNREDKAYIKRNVNTYEDIYKSPAVVTSYRGDKNCFVFDIGIILRHIFNDKINDYIDEKDIYQNYNFPKLFEYDVNNVITINIKDDILSDKNIADLNLNSLINIFFNKIDSVYKTFVSNYTELYEAIFFDFSNEEKIIYNEIDKIYSKFTNSNGCINNNFNDMLIFTYNEKFLSSTNLLCEFYNNDLVYVITPLYDMLNDINSKIIKPYNTFNDYDKINSLIISGNYLTSPYFKSGMEDYLKSIEYINRGIIHDPNEELKEDIKNDLKTYPSRSSGFLNYLLNIHNLLLNLILRSCYYFNRMQKLIKKNGIKIVNKFDEEFVDIIKDENNNLSVDDFIKDDLINIRIKDKDIKLISPDSYRSNFAYFIEKAIYFYKDEILKILYKHLKYHMANLNFKLQNTNHFSYGENDKLNIQRGDDVKKTYLLFNNMLTTLKNDEDCISMIYKNYDWLEELSSRMKDDHNNGFWIVGSHKIADEYFSTNTLDEMNSSMKKYFDTVFYFGNAKLYGCFEGQFSNYYSDMGFSSEITYSPGGEPRTKTGKTSTLISYVNNLDEKGNVQSHGAIVNCINDTVTHNKLLENSKNNKNVDKFDIISVVPYNTSETDKSATVDTYACYAGKSSIFNKSENKNNLVALSDMNKCSINYTDSSGKVDPNFNKNLNDNTIIFKIDTKTVYDSPNVEFLGCYKKNIPESGIYNTLPHFIGGISSYLSAIEIIEKCSKLVSDYNSTMGTNFDIYGLTTNSSDTIQLDCYAGTKNFDAKYALTKKNDAYQENCNIYYPGTDNFMIFQDIDKVTNPCVKPEVDNLQKYNSLLTSYLNKNVTDQQKTISEIGESLKILGELFPIKFAVSGIARTMDSAEINIESILSPGLSSETLNKTGSRICNISLKVQDGPKGEQGDPGEYGEVGQIVKGPPGDIGNAGYWGKTK